MCVGEEVFIAENKLKLDVAQRLLAAEGTPFLTVTEKHIDVNGLSAREILQMRHARLHV